MRLASRILVLAVVAGGLVVACPAAAQDAAPAGPPVMTDDRLLEVQDATPPEGPVAEPLSPDPSAGEVSTPALEQEQPPPITPPGQWVYTDQYGWIWMPYSEAYTYVPPDGWGAPYQYVYGAALGWTWVVAPWVWGWGPWPYFGVIGPVHYGWWHHGWWRDPWRWHYVPAPVGHRPGEVRGPPVRGVPVRPVPGFRSPAPGLRPAPGVHSPGVRSTPGFRPEAGLRPSPGFRSAPGFSRPSIGMASPSRPMVGSVSPGFSRPSFGSASPGISAPAPSRAPAAGGFAPRGGGMVSPGR